MNADPVVTVVIPTYNHAEFLREALDSVRGQTFPEWEAIVVNNYSDDHTIQVVQSFNDDRIRLDNFRNDGVIGASRNRGIAAARGRYVAFLDSDDKWYPAKLERCVPFLESGSDLVCHGVRMIGDRGAGEMHCGPEHRATVDALVYDGNCLVTSATVVRKTLLDAVGGFSEDPEAATAEDYHLWIKLARAGARMSFSRDLLGEYRVHAGNQTGSVMRHLNAMLRVSREFFPPPAQRSLVTRVRVRRAEAFIFYATARGMQHAGDFSRAWPLFGKALLMWPFALKTYAGMALNVARRSYP